MKRLILAAALIATPAAANDFDLEKQAQVAGWVIGLHDWARDRCSSILTPPEKMRPDLLRISAMKLDAVIEARRRTYELYDVMVQAEKLAPTCASALREIADVHKSVERN